MMLEEDDATVVTNDVPNWRRESWMLARSRISRRRCTLCGINRFCLCFSSLLAGRPRWTESRPDPSPLARNAAGKSIKKAVVIAGRSTVEERRRRRAARTAMSPGMKPAQTVTPLNSQPPPVRPHATRLSARAATYPQSTKPQQQKMHVHSGVRACNRRTGVYIRPKPQHTQRKKWGGGKRPTANPQTRNPASAAAHNSPCCARCDWRTIAPKSNKNNRTCTAGFEPVAANRRIY